jgi:mannose-1-phosphate guanylyltransferase/mannose-1-phosphate guanylyltransferase/mannose-6-phosphate isomerase
MDGLPHHYKEERPWGSFERFTLNEPSTVKIITVAPGEAFSLQTHEHRDEYWRVLSGSGWITSGSETRDARPGDSFFTSRGQRHRAEAGPDGLAFLEIALGEFDEDDITRLEDKYGRVQ